MNLKHSITYLLYAIFVIIGAALFAWYAFELTMINATLATTLLTVATILLIALGLSSSENDPLPATPRPTPTPEPMPPAEPIRHRMPPKPAAAPEALTQPLGASVTVTISYTDAIKIHRQLHRLLVSVEKGKVKADQFQLKAGHGGVTVAFPD